MGIRITKGLVKTQISGPPSHISDSVGLGWVLKIFISTSCCFVQGTYFDWFLEKSFRTIPTPFHPLLSRKAQRFGCTDPLCPLDLSPFLPRSKLYAKKSVPTIFLPCFQKTETASILFWIAQTGVEKKCLKRRGKWNDKQIFGA